MPHGAWCLTGKAAIGPVSTDKKKRRRETVGCVTWGAMKKPTLYYHPSSFESQIVKLALAEKGVAFTPRPLDLESKSEHLKPWYLELNREAEVPTLQHKDMTLGEMVTICVYINNNFPGPMLVPIRGSEREEMEEWVRLFQQFPHQEFSIGVLRGPEKRTELGKLRQWIKTTEKLGDKHAELDVRYQHTQSKYEKWASLAEDDRFISRAKTRIEKSLDLLDRRLKQSRWLAGNDYSLADTLWTVLLARLHYLGLSSLWANGARPNVDSFYQRVRARSSFSKARIQTTRSPFNKVLLFFKYNWENLVLAGIVMGTGMGLMMSAQ